MSTRTATALPDALTVADAGRVAAAEQAESGWSDPDVYEVATAAAFRYAAVYPIAERAVEVCIAPAAVNHIAGGDLLTADSIANSAATVILDLAAEASRVPLSRGHIATMAPGVLRLTW